MKSCLVGLLIFIFIILFLPAVDFINYKFTILSPNFYKKIFRENHTYEKLSESIPGLLGMTSNGQEKTDQQFVQIIQNTATPSFLQTQIESLLDSMPKILEGKSTDINISIVEYKQNLLKNLSSNADIPICSPDQSKNQQNQNLDCLPLNLGPTNKQQSGKTPQNINEAIPDTINLGDYISQDAGINKIVFYHKIYKLSLIILPILLILILISIVLLSLPSARTAIKRVGSAIFTASILLLVYASIIKYLLASTYLSQILFQKLQILSNPIIKEILVPVSSSIFKGYSAHLFTWSLISVGLGIILLIAGSFLPKIKNDTTQAPAN